MAITGEIKTLYSDSERTKIILPLTKTKAVSNDNGVGLDTLMKNLPYYSDSDNSETATTPLDADTLGGRLASDYATQTFVANKIAEAQLGGGSGGDIDLSGYATKDDLAKIDYPVDSVNGKTGAISLSASDVGAAPSGYGLGGIAIEVQDMDDATACGWYIFHNQTANTPFGYGVAMTISRYGTRFVQIAFNPFMDGVGEICVRSYSGSEWKPWEYINPPMYAGREYRTIERHLGKPVYVTRFSFGALPNNNDTTIYHVQSNVDQVVSVDMETYDVGGTKFGGLLPNVVGYWAGVTTDNEMYLKIKTNADITSYTSYLIVKYTKK